MKKNLSILAVLFLVLLISSCGQEDYKRINEVGVVGVGIIDKIESTNVTVNDNPQVRIYVTVYSLKQDAFEGSFKRVISRYSSLEEGQWVPIKYDPKENDKMIWVDDEDITPEVQSQLDKINETAFEE